MSYSKKRIDYNNNWPDKVIIFSAQEAYDKLLKDKGVPHILRPIKIPLIEEYEFQRLLSFKIDIYEQLPNRPDIAFDLAWRNFEAYSVFFSVSKGWSTSKTHKILYKVCEDILLNQYNSNVELANSFSNLINNVPLQATEFLIKRLLESNSNALKSQQNKIIERFIEITSQDLFECLKIKYDFFTPENQRKAGLLLQLLIKGNEVEINTQKFKLTLIQQLKLITNGILYTYRNERFHGDSFSPFKCSATRLKTYAHSYYCLIATYFFISQLIFHHYPNKFKLSEIAEQLDDNTNRFVLVFGNQLKA